MDGFECFSSWEKRNDKIGESKITGTDNNSPNSHFNKAKNGFYCMESNKYQYLSIVDDPIWFEVDLKSTYVIKCIRVTTRAFETLFKEVEFRFGNESQSGNYKLNPVVGVIGRRTGVIVELCLDYPLVGRYLGLRQYFRSQFLVGEIQVTVQEKK